MSKQKNVFSQVYIHTEQNDIEKKSETKWPGKF